MVSTGHDPRLLDPRPWFAALGSQFGEFECEVTGERFSFSIAPYSERHCRLWVAVEHGFVDLGFGAGALLSEIPVADVDIVAVAEAIAQGRVFDEHRRLLGVTTSARTCADLGNGLSLCSTSIMVPESHDLCPASRLRPLSRASIRRRYLTNAPLPQPGGPQIRCGTLAPRPPRPYTPRRERP